MSLLLGAFYYIVGAIMAFLWSSAVGFVLCVPICLLRLFRHRRNALLMLTYVALGAVCAVIFLGLGRLTQTVADKTAHAGYMMLFVGMAIPGLVALAIIPSFIKIALRQTSGDVDVADV